MTLQTWLLFCATETVLCFTPGPAVLLVISMSLTRGGPAGILASLGILAANTGYFILSATSLGAVLLASGQLFLVIKWLGAAYLIWLGARMVVSASRPVESAEVLRESTFRHGRSNAFLHGFVTQVANPKALVFFTALLPQFIDPRSGVVVQVAVLSVSSILIELFVLSLYVAACGKARRWARAPRFAASLQRIGGLLLVVAGARLVASRHA